MKPPTRKERNTLIGPIGADWELVELGRAAEPPNTVLPQARLVKVTRNLYASPTLKGNESIGQLCRTVIARHQTFPSIDSDRVIYSSLELARRRARVRSSSIHQTLYLRRI